MKGKLKWWDDKKQFAIVYVENVGDVLMHRDTIKDFDSVKDKLVAGTFWKVFVIAKFRSAMSEFEADAK
jgi:phenylalanine-4-hydroxylase